jgi:hypothetical protein
MLPVGKSRKSAAVPPLKNLRASFAPSAVFIELLFEFLVGLSVDSGVLRRGRTPTRRCPGIVTVDPDRCLKSMNGEFQALAAPTSSEPHASHRSPDLIKF